MKYPLNAITSVVEILMRSDARRATKFLTDKQIVRATRKVVKGKFIDKVGNNLEIILTLGKPNFAEREFIKACKKAGEKFPVRNIQLKFLKAKKK